MMTETTIIDFFRLGSVGAILAVSVFVFRYRGNPVADSFVWTVLSMCGWALFTLIPDIVDPPFDLPVVSTGVIELGAFVAGGLTAIFSYVYLRLYTGHSQYTNIRRVLIVALPVLIMTVIHFFAAPWLIVDTSVPSPLFVILQLSTVLVILYVATLFFLGLYLLGRLVLRYNHIPYGQVGLIYVGLLAPYIAVVASSLTEPTSEGGTVSLLPLDVSFAGFLLASVAFTAAVRTYPLFTPYPDAEYIARDEVVENLGEGVFILNQDGQVLDMNATATEYTDMQVNEVFGCQILSVINGLSRLPANGIHHVALQTPEGVREVEIRTSAITEGGEGSLGTIVRLKDITEQKTREQQLEVLTRVLRHNLRNNIDTALAYTNEIEDPEIRSQIRSKLHGLVETGNKARDVEEVLSYAHEPYSRVDLAELLRKVAKRFEQECECDIEVEATDELVVITHRELLDRLLSELIENAIEHNIQDTPGVVISLLSFQGETRSIEIKISDDGPGIPEHEREVITEGTETPLKHGTGIGLWLVNWIVDSLGGELLFPEDGDGNTVVVRLNAMFSDPIDTGGDDDQG